MFFICLTSAIESTEQNEKRQLERYIVDMADGSTDSMLQLYEKTKTAVFSFSLSILKNRQDAEDVLQDTFVRIYHSAPRYKENGNPMPWIITIAKNLSLMKLREKKKETDLPEQAWHNLCFDDSEITSDDRLVLNHLLDTLTSKEREIVLLHITAGLKFREIAEISEIPLPTVLSKYHRAIKKMQKEYERSENECPAENWKK